MSSYETPFNTATGSQSITIDRLVYVKEDGKALDTVYSTAVNEMTDLSSDRWFYKNVEMAATSTITSTVAPFGSGDPYQLWINNSTNKTITGAECDKKFNEFKMESQLVFDNAGLLRVLITWVVFLISAVGNCFVLTSVTIRRRRRMISHPQLMMMHLTIANLAFTVFILPVDAIWKTTLEWHGGDVLCRVTNVLKQFSMYISSAMIVVMGIDRVANLMCPMSLTGQRRRIRTMLALAWTFCFLNAVPAGFIFSFVRRDFTEDCPGYTVMQCVDLKVLNQTNLEAYYVYTMFVSFFGPLICILICYLLIAVSISKMARVSKEAQKRCLKRGSSKSVTKRGLDRARRVSLVVTGLISITFIICWGPYYVAGLIEWFDKQEHVSSPEYASSPPEPRLSRTARDVMLMSMYLNPMLHPLITVFLMKEIRENILNQFQRTSSRGRKLPNRKAAGILVKLEKNGTKELVPRNDEEPVEARRQWL